MKYIATVDGRDLELDVDRRGEITVDGERLAVDLRAVGGSQTYSLLLDNRSYEFFVERRPGGYDLMIEGDRFSVDVEDARLKQLKAMGGAEHVEGGAATVYAPMPGLVVKLLVVPGDLVEANQGLLILEAMKMENEIRAPKAGLIRSIGAVAGQTVGQGDVLLTIEAPVEA
jgi:pyruvate carboxylase subunit B